MDSIDQSKPIFMALVRFGGAEEVGEGADGGGGGGGGEDRCMVNISFSSANGSRHSEAGR